MNAGPWGLAAAALLLTGAAQAVTTSEFASKAPVSTAPAPPAASAAAKAPKADRPDAGRAGQAPPPAAPKPAR